MACERQLDGRRVDAGVRGVGAGLRQIDEYRFAVTQLDSYPLTFSGWGLTRVDNAKGVAEVAVLVGENAQHCHVDGHVADATWAPKSGGAALVGTHGVEHCDAGVDGSGDRTLADA